MNNYYDTNLKKDRLKFSNKKIFLLTKLILIIM